jgi:hypothetical protein
LAGGGPPYLIKNLPPVWMLPSGLCLARFMSDVGA